MYQDLIKDIKSSLIQYADPERIEFAKRVYPTELEVIGVKSPDLKLILKEVKASTVTFSVKEKINLAKALIDTKILECLKLGFDYIDNNRNIIQFIKKEDLDYLGRYMDNWVTSDYFGTYVLGAVWQRGAISIDYILTFAHSEDIWRRRAALVSTVSLNQKARGGKGDIKQTLEICILFINDHEDMIVKALSWALRILSQVDHKSVTYFITKHKNELHPRVIREVNKKLDTGRKN